MNEPTRCPECGGAVKCTRETDFVKDFECENPKNFKCQTWKESVTKPKK